MSTADLSISVCIPVYNGARWVREAMTSVLAQTRADFELVVVDNCSSDGSLELVCELARSDERIRVVENTETVGAAPNHNRCLELAKGDLVKFLHHDDRLRPDCLERMAGVLEAHPSVGLVFSRREILLDDPSDPRAQAWKREYERLHDRFESLGEVNGGGALLSQYLPALGGADFANWIGEPSAVMLRRSALEQIGGFDGRVRQSFDIGLWLRLMAAHDVGFIDEPLVTFRHHSDSLTAGMAARRDDWLDLLWILETLLADPSFETERRQLTLFRRRELLRTVKRQLGRIARGNADLRPLGNYLRYRLGSSG